MTIVTKKDVVNNTADSLQEKIDGVLGRMVFNEKTISIFLKDCSCFIKKEEVKKELTLRYLNAGWTSVSFSVYQAGNDLNIELS